MFNDWYWQQYEKLLDMKDLLDDELARLEEKGLQNSKKYKEMDEQVLDILDIQCYIDKALENINKKYRKIVRPV